MGVRTASRALATLLVVAPTLIGAAACEAVLPLGPTATLIEAASSDAASDAGGPEGDAGEDAPTGSDGLVCGMTAHAMATCNACIETHCCDAWAACAGSETCREAATCRREGFGRSN